MGDNYFLTSFDKMTGTQARIQGGGGAFGACAPPLSLMPNEIIYGD